MPTSELSAAQQAFALRARFPGARGTLKAGRLVWTGSLQPTPLSRTYTVQIVYGLRAHPQVRVLDELATREGASLPHVYRDGTVCLYKANEWEATMMIVDTIVPWTAEWLAYYEVWLVTGIWYGGGEWPPARSGRKVAEESASHVVHQSDEPPAQAA